MSDFETCMLHWLCTLPTFPTVTYYEHTQRVLAQNAIFVSRILRGAGTLRCVCVCVPASLQMVFSDYVLKYAPLNNKVLWRKRQMEPGASIKAM